MYSTRTILVAVFVALPAGMGLAQDSGGDVISLANASQLRSVTEIDRNVRRVRRGPGTGELTLRLSNGSIQIVDDKHLTPIRTIGKRQSREYRVSPDQTLVAILDRGFIRITNAKTGKVVQVKAGMDVHEFAFSPDSQLLAIGDTGSRPGDNEGDGFTDVRIVNAGSGQLVHRMPRDESGWSALHPVFSPNGKVLAIGSRNYVTRLYDVATGKLMHILNKRMTHEIAFSPDSKVLAASYVDGTLGLWSVKTGRMLQSTKSGDIELYSVDWSPAGDLLVSSGHKGSVRVWDPRTLRMVKELRKLAWGISTEFTQDGKHIVSSGKTESNKHLLNVWALRPFDSEVSDSTPQPKLDIDVAHEWARQMLEKSRSSFPPNMRGNTSLPLARPITSLHLYNVSLTDEELRNLAAFPKLKSLDVSGKGITDAGVKYLSALKELETLGLHGAVITDTGMKRLARLRNLKRLDLSGAKFTDATLLELADLPKLRELALERTRITDEALRHVKKMKELRELSLRRTKISNDGLRHLAMMPNLREITLQSTPVTGEGLRHLAACKSLRTINCWGADVTSEDIRRLKEVLPQCEIDKTLIE